MSLTIGLCFDLRSTYLAEGYSAEETAEFDQEETIEALESTLRALGHIPVRIGHGRQLAAALAAGARWDLVFNIAEGLHGLGREAQVPALLDLYQIAYAFSDPLVMSLSLHKGMTKRILRDAQVATADFVVMQDPPDLTALSFPGPYFIKPVAEGTGKGISLASIIANRAELEKACLQLRDRYQQPVLVEPYLSGREFTTGLVGTGSKAKVLGTMEVLLLPEAEQGVYSYTNKEEWRTRVRYRLLRPEDDPVITEAESIALSAWRVLGCRDGGRIDLRCDAKGKPMFMEVNPLAGLHPHHSDLPILCQQLGLSYTELIRLMLDSALERRLYHTR